MSIRKRPWVRDQTTWSNATLDRRIADGKFVKSVALGDRSVGWDEEEVSIVVAAIGDGASDEEIKALVADLHAARRRDLEGVLAAARARASDAAVAPA